MSRKAVRQQVGVALFPFLAVLICTMGALIVLLVLLVQQARVDARTIAAAQGQRAAAAAAGAQQWQERLEDAQWQRELLEKSRQEKTEELAQSRARLAHLEEHIQRLETQAKELLERARSIDEGKKLRDDELAAARAEAERLKSEIARKRIELAEAKRKQAGQPDSYALIPYDGPNGTRRRPIYIECTEFGVILQPEGLILKSEDFSGPMGPGNPLDTALRAIREHIERTAGNSAGLPYPLIVVRPGGIIAYGAARAAMRAWDDEFGYELVSDDKHIDFGPPDPALSQILNRQVAAARQRQALMAAMMPRQFQNAEPLKSFAADSSTSVAPAGAMRTGGGLGQGGSAGPGFADGTSAGSRTGFAGGGQARTATGPQASGQAGGSLSGSSGPYGSGPSGAGSAIGGSSPGSVPGGLPSVAAGGAPGGTGTFGYGSTSTANANSSAGANAGSSQHGFAPATNQAAGGFGGTDSSVFPATPLAATAGNESASHPGGDGASGGTSGLAGQPGGTAGGAASPYLSGTAAPGAAGGGSTLGGGAPGMPGQSAGGPNLNFDFGQKKTAGGGSASQPGPKTRTSRGRGNNWALLDVKPHSIGVTRPIHIQVHPDRMVLMPDRGDSRAPLVVKVAPELTPDDVNRFVAAVQNEVKGWGLAVSDGYWKPVLQAEIAPGAERHFSNLQTALSGSGIEVVRR